jgi:hypothetical protein
MLAVANYIMKGPFQANLSVVLLTALSILMSPFGLLAGAAIALITLRVSPVEGVKNLVIALITLFGLNMVVGSGVNLALIAAFEFFLPVFVLSLLLRRTNSLALTLEGAALMVVAALMIFYLSVDSPSAWWMGIFDQYLSPLLSQADVTYDATAMLSLAEMMTMLLSVFLLSLWFLIILIARWWQGALYYPGRFQQDFHQLSLSNNAVWIAIVSCIAALFVGSGLIYDIAALLIAVFMFQGLAIAHHSVTQKQASNGWLVGIYLLLFLLPQTMLILATLGLLDRWIKVRNRWS